MKRKRKENGNKRCLLFVGLNVNGDRTNVNVPQKGTNKRRNVKSDTTPTKSKRNQRDGGQTQSARSKKKQQQIKKNPIKDKAKINIKHEGKH